MTESAELAETKHCDCDLVAIVVAMRWTAERRTPQQARDDKIGELAWHLGWGSLRGRGGRRALLERFVAVETGPAPKPDDVVYLNILHMTAAWHRHVREFARVEDWMAHAAIQEDGLQDKPPQVRARVTHAVRWILAHRHATPYRRGGMVHRANAREVLAMLWGFSKGESLRRALAADRQQRTVATWVDYLGLYAALHGRTESPRRWTDKDRAAFHGWARWTFPDATDL